MQLTQRSLLRFGRWVYILRSGHYVYYVLCCVRCVRCAGWKTRSSLKVVNHMIHSGVFRGGMHGAMPPLWPNHENFLQATLYEKMRFCHYPTRIGRICGFHWTFKSKKCFSFRGASPLWPPDQDSAPGPRWGLRSETPVIGSRSARSPCPPLPNPKYATDDTHQDCTTAMPVGLKIYSSDGRRSSDGNGDEANERGKAKQTAGDNQ